MGIERLISLESGSLLEIDGFTGDVSIQTTVVRTGTRSMRIANHNVSGQYSALIKVPARDEYYIQLVIYPTDEPAADTNPYVKILGPSNTVVATLTAYRLLLKAYLGNSNTYVGDIGTIPANTWSVLQIRLKLHDTAGVFQAKLGSDLTLDYHGNTIVTSATTINALQILNLIRTSGHAYYDDVIIHNALGSRNNSWPNGARLYRLVPNGAGTYTQWTPSAGSNWDCLEEVPPSSSDFVRPTAADQTDTYHLTNLPPEVIQVSGLVVEYWGETIGSPAINAIKPVIRMNDNDYVGSTVSLSPVFSPIQVPYDQAPDGTLWTVAKIDNMEVGQRSASV